MAGELGNILLNPLFGKEVTTPGASSVTASAPFDKYGILPPEIPPAGALDPYFPGGTTTSRQNALSPEMTKGLNSLTPIMVAAGLLPLTQRGTGRYQPGYIPNRPNAMPFPLPSESLAKLMASQRRG